MQKPTLSGTICWRRGGNKRIFFHSSQFIFMGVESSFYFSVEFSLIMKRGFLHEYDIQ